ncbi:MAG: hypothetical protein GF344_05590 [Chitinivibrionales bacterium]|nr:hypothetical protein [Chitinivibrionales bacterium]
MPDERDFEAMRERIEALDPAQVREPDRPVETKAQQAEATALWAKDDKAKFDAVNFHWQLVTDIPVMAGALRWSEVVWANRRKLQEDAQKALHALVPVAEDLRDDVLEALDYVGDEDEGLQARIVEIRDGDSHADLVLDCQAVVDLARQHRALLESMNFDMDKLGELAQMGDRLAGALGGSDVGKLKKSEEKAVRDRAYTLLDNALRKVRKCGRYVCRDDEERLKGYIDSYSRAAYRRRRSREQQEQQQAQPAL